MMEFTVGIIFHNEEKNLPRVLASLVHLPAHKLILVDNASTDRSVQMAQSFSRGEIILRSENSLAGARQDILLRTQTDYLYFIDADCEVLPNTWAELMRKFNSSSVDVCAWGGSQVFPRESEVLELLDKMRQSYLGHFGSAQMKTGDKVSEVDHLSTTHVLYHVPKLKSVGGFDLRLNKSAEDLEISLRLHKAGYKLLFIPQSRIVHRVATTWREWWRKAFRNGVWQTRLIAYNADILKTVRPWPALFFPFFLFFGFKFWILGYFVLILATAVKAKEVRLVGVYFFTHTAYATGELFGFVLAIFDKLLPRKTKL